MWFLDGLTPLLPLTPTHVLVPRDGGRGLSQLLKIPLATLPSRPVLEAREGKGSNTGEGQKARARVESYLRLPRSRPALSVSL